MKSGDMAQASHGLGLSCSMRSVERTPGHTLLVGCGYVGARLARKLGGVARALVRTSASSQALASEGIPAQAADLDQLQPGVAMGPPPEAVVYLAPPQASGTEDVRLARCLAALEAARPRVLIYLSTTGVYGDAGGGRVDEDTPPRPIEDRSRRRLDAEARAAAWSAERGARCVLLRVPAIYGPFRLPLDRLQRGEPVLREEDSGPGNRIHVDDLVGACLAALSGEASGVFNLVDGDGRSFGAFQDALADLAGLPRPRRVDWAEAQRLLSPGLLAFLRESRRVSSRRSRELGWTPTYGDPGEGIRACLTEMGWKPGP